MLGGRITICVMEYKYHPKPIYGIYTFFLVYVAEAVLPSDIRHDSPRVVNYVEADNEKARQELLTC